jgi:hypothetical protein
MLMKSRSAPTHRAWQLLPRHLRRRAASHDPRRVPLRLREKARFEVCDTRAGLEVVKFIHNLTDGSFNEESAEAPQTLSQKTTFPN